MSKICGWLAILATIALTYFLAPNFCNNIFNIISSGDIAALSEYIKSFGHLSVLIIILLFVVMTFTVVFPFMILSGATAIIYGIFWGTAISWTGEVIGAIFMFFFARYFFRSFVEKKIANSSYLKQVDDYSSKKGFKILLIARLLPLAPSGIITAIAAISKISFRDFLWATILGKLPPVIIKVLLGHDLVYASDNMMRLIAVIAAVVLIYAYVWWRKRQNKPIF